MKIAYFDCPSGAAGDMIMGALVDAGASFEALRDTLHGLAVPGWELTRREVMKGVFRATKVDVEIDPNIPQYDPTQPPAPGIDIERPGEASPMTG